MSGMESKVWHIIKRQVEDIVFLLNFVLQNHGWSFPILGVEVMR